jgi:hypothetical protein
MPTQPPRVGREVRTVEAMVRLYCRDHHQRGEALCTECTDLLHYARARLDRCPYQERKPTCVKCPVHCYRPAMRERIRVVMRYAGPRMLLHRPGLALLHLIVGLRAEKSHPPSRAEPR